MFPLLVLILLKLIVSRMWLKSPHKLPPEWTIFDFEDGR